MIDPQAPEQPSAESSDSETQKELSAEEQMERFEEDLKESDWGHQPC